MNKVRISIITPTIRARGLALVAKALSKQTFRDFEWIIVTPLKGEEFDWEIEEGQKFDIPNMTLVAVPQKEKGTVWSLNRDYNIATRLAKGNLIISWQDYTFAKPDTLANFWEHFIHESNCLVSAVGNKYENENWDIMTWKDPRIKDQESLRVVGFDQIEANLCSIPRCLIEKVGGWDEKLDNFFGMDCYGLFNRMAIEGTANFKIDESIKSYSLPHGRYKDWEEKNAIHGAYRDIFLPKYLNNPVLT